MKIRFRLLIAAALAGGLLTAGCAQSANPEANVTPSPSGDGSQPSFRPLPVPTSLPSTAEPPGASSKDEVVVTGTVETIGVEGGCKALRDTANKLYELKGGDAGVLAVGARVTVRGKIRTDLMTICQIGPVLEVASSQRA
jgi:hypothetical protein